MWYGLLVDGTLYRVRWIPEGQIPEGQTPSLFDFDWPDDETSEHVIVRVEVVIQEHGRRRLE